MISLRISLFGRFRVHYQAHLLAGFEAGKLQELFAFLLLHRRAPQSRELLATLFWGDLPTAQARKQLRQALWQLQHNLAACWGGAAEHLLAIENDWVCVAAPAELWLDVAVFEQAFALAQGVAGAKLHDEQAEALRAAAALYQADLLCNCYADWCLVERERLRQQRLVMLDKLMSYCEQRAEYEAGINWGEQILQCDRARERTHRQLMRLYYLAGDRTGALRQYQRCAAVLHEELGIHPAQSTHMLCDQIRNDQPLPSALASAPTAAPAAPELDGWLGRICSDLAQLQHRMRQDVEALENLLRSRQK